MTTKEAKFILGARRPDGRDDADLVVAEALNQARRDPGLAGWMAREQAFDKVVVKRLRAIEPPDHLRETILAGIRVSRPSRFWRRPQVLALAASVALIFALTLAWAGLRPTGVERLANHAMDEVRSVAHHSAGSRARGALETFLSDPTTRLAAGLPFDVGQLKTGGCRSVSFGRHEIFEVCFERTGERFHLYIADRNHVGGKDDGAQFREDGLISSVAWTDQRYAYVLVTDKGRTAVRSIF